MTRTTATTADNSFVKPAIESTEALTGNKVERVYADGAYYSEGNQHLNAEMLLTGITGTQARYHMELQNDQLYATDTHTGEIIEAEWRPQANKWRIRTEKGWRYITDIMLKSQALRDRLAKIPKEIRNKREATISHFAGCLKGNKSRYRGLLKHRFQAYTRCLWINHVRITNFETQKAFQLA